MEDIYWRQEFEYKFAVIFWSKLDMREYVQNTVTWLKNYAYCLIPMNSKDRNVSDTKTAILYRSSFFISTK